MQTPNSKKTSPWFLGSGLLLSALTPNVSFAQTAGLLIDTDSNTLTNTSSTINGSIAADGAEAGVGILVSGNRNFIRFPNSGTSINGGFGTKLLSNLYSSENGGNGGLFSGNNNEFMLEGNLIGGSTAALSFDYSHSGVSGKGLEVSGNNNIFQINGDIRSGNSGNVAGNTTYSGDTAAGLKVTGVGNSFYINGDIASGKTGSSNGANAESGDSGHGVDIQGNYTVLEITGNISSGNVGDVAGSAAVSGSSGNGINLAGQSSNLYLRGNITAGIPELTLNASPNSSWLGGNGIAIYSSSNIINIEGNVKGRNGIIFAGGDDNLLLLNSGKISSGLTATGTTNSSQGYALYFNSGIRNDIRIGSNFQIEGDMYSEVMGNTVSFGVDNNGVTNGDMVYNHSITNFNIVKWGQGNLTLTKNNMASFQIYVHDGTLSYVGDGNARSFYSNYLLNLTLVENSTFDMSQANGDRYIGFISARNPGRENSTQLFIKLGANRLYIGETDTGSMGTASWINAVISGTGGLTLEKTTVHLSNHNTYTGDTIIKSTAVLELGHEGIPGSAANSNLINNGSVVYNSYIDTTQNSVISGTGTINKNDSGTLFLTKNNTNTGLFTINDGVVSVGTGSTSGSIANDVVNLSELVFNRSDTSTYAGALSGSGILTKKGVGQLNLTGLLTYEGLTQVQVGQLSFNTDISQLEDDIVVSPGAKVIFNNTSQTTLNTDILSSDPLLPFDAVNAPTAIKEATNTLIVKGNTHVNWLVNQGTLVNTGTVMNGNINLRPSSELSFAMSPTVHTILTGGITADATSLISLDRPNGSLTIRYKALSTMGNVEARSGELIFMQNTPQSSILQYLDIAGNLTVRNDATVSVSGADTYIKIGENFNIEGSSFLNVTADPNRPEADIIVKNAIISNTAELRLSGFGVGNNFDLSLTDFDLLQKVTDLPSVNYVFLHAENAISGTFTNIHDNSTGLNNYLVYTSGVQNNLMGGQDYVIGGVKLAWTDGGNTSGTGTFDMAALTGINIDVPLNNMTGPFATGWDGKSLTKKGQGVLMLSHPNNQYTGKTLIQGGILYTATDNAIQRSTELEIDSDGTLFLGNTSQNIFSLQGNGSIDLGTGHFNLLNLNQSSAAIQSQFNGSIQGGTSSSSAATGTFRVLNGQMKFGGQINVGLLELNTPLGTTFQNGSSNQWQTLKLIHTQVDVIEASQLFGAIEGDPNSSVSLSNQSSWTLNNSSTLGSIKLNSTSRIDFGSHNILPSALARSSINSRSTPSSRSLTVDRWSGSGGTLTLYGTGNADSILTLDRVTINQTATGQTTVTLVNEGGIDLLLNSGGIVRPILGGPGSQIGDNKFIGTFDAGVDTYLLKYDPNTVSYYYVKDTTKRSPIVNENLPIIGIITRGPTSNAVSSLANFGDFFDPYNLNSCDTLQSFGATSGASGSMRTSSQVGKSSYNQGGFIVGSDVYNLQLEDACLHTGFFGGFQNTTAQTNDLVPTTPNRHTNKISTYYAGSYIQINSNDNWYSNFALAHYWNNLSVEKSGNQPRDFNATSWVASTELGKHYPLNDMLRLTPSVQLLHQYTSVDRSGNAQVKDVHSTFMRVGAKAVWQVAPDYAWTLQSNVWHQFDQQITTKAYGSNNQYLNEATDSYNKTWSDIKFGFEYTDKNLSSFANVGYSGSFNKNNTATGSIGFKYQW